MDATDNLTEEELEAVLAKRRAKKAAEPAPDDNARAEAIFDECQKTFHRYNVALHRDVRDIVTKEVAKGLAALRASLVSKLETDGWEE